MRGVAKVFQINFPISVVNVFENPASDLDLALGRAIDHIVERRRHVAKPAVEVVALGRLVDKNESAVRRHSRYGIHRHRGVLGAEVRRITVLERYRLQSTVQMVRPAVITALKFVGVAFVERHHHGAAMGALVVQRVQFAVGAADDHDRFAAKLGTEIIARLFDLALVTDVDPRRTENAFELKFENSRIIVKATMNHARPHQADYVFSDLVKHRFHPDKTLHCANAKSTELVRQTQGRARWIAAPWGGFLVIRNSHGLEGA